MPLNTEIECYLRRCAWIFCCCRSPSKITVQASARPSRRSRTMNGPGSLNQSITAAWSTPAVPKKRTKRAIPLNSSTSSSPGPSDPTQPQASTSALPTPEDRPPTPSTSAPARRKRPRHDPEQLAAKYAPPDLKLGSLGGLESQITQLMEIVVLPLLHPEIYLHTGVSRPRGVLLHGVPGGGKTQLVKCLAGVSCRAPEGSKRI